MEGQTIKQSKNTVLKCYYNETLSGKNKLEHFDASKLKSQRVFASIFLWGETNLLFFPTFTRIS